ncbi:hypothetical protein HAX54_029147 [Datura stramonium]|uniref:Uncharacterized protein n=1 Tax=Datura stramonium TaxID=4076 RepID=A0ABS8V5M7_DATST|nr:hypothetical protein [Datura stramonium]
MIIWDGVTPRTSVVTDTLIVSGGTTFVAVGSIRRVCDSEEAVTPIVWSSTLGENEVSMVTFPGFAVATLDVGGMVVGSGTTRLTGSDPVASPTIPMSNGNPDIRLATNTTLSSPKALAPPVENSRNHTTAH